MQIDQEKDYHMGHISLGTKSNIMLEEPRAQLVVCKTDNKDMLYSKLLMEVKLDYAASASRAVITKSMTS